MKDSKTNKTRRRPGPAPKPESRKLVMVGVKVTPEVAVKLERIAQEKRWTISGTIRYACELLVDSELSKAA